jgi:hypothetical protein
MAGDCGEVHGKSWLFLGLALLLTFPLVITVNYLGDPDNGVILASYVGCLLLAGSYLAVSCMTSALTRNQVVSFILAVVLCLFLILAGFPAGDESDCAMVFAGAGAVGGVVQCDHALRQLSEGIVGFAGYDLFPVGDRVHVVHDGRDFARAPGGLSRTEMRHEIEIA